VSIFSKIRSLFKRPRKEEVKEEPVKQEEGFTKFVLKVMNPKKRGGWEKVAEFEDVVTPDEVVTMLDEGTIEKVIPGGIYRLDGYVHGKFKTLWKIKYFPDEMEEEEEERREVRHEQELRRRVGGLGELDALVEQLRAVAEQRKKLAELAELLSEVAGTKRATEEDLIDAFMSLKKKYDKLQELFGTVKASMPEEAQIPIKGEIPAWAVYLPNVLDKMMEKVEQRLNRIMKITSGETEGEQQRSVSAPPFPEFPEVGGSSDLGSGQGTGMSVGQAGKQLEAVTVSEGVGTVDVLSAPEEFRGVDVEYSEPEVKVELESDVSTLEEIPEEVEEEEKDIEVEEVSSGEVDEESEDEGSGGVGSEGD